MKLFWQEERTKYREGSKSVCRPGELLSTLLNGIDFIELIEIEFEDKCDFTFGYFI